MEDPFTRAAPRVTSSSPSPVETVTAWVVVFPNTKVSSPEPVVTLRVAAFSVPRARSPLAALPSMLSSVETSPRPPTTRSASPDTVMVFSAAEAPLRVTLLAVAPLLARVRASAAASTKVTLVVGTPSLPTLLAFSSATFNAWFSVVLTTVTERSSSRFFTVTLAMPSPVSVIFPPTPSRATSVRVALAVRVETVPALKLAFSSPSHPETS